MKKLRIFFTDIDGYLVDANIQKYVSQIELFGDETIKDFEYIQNCIKYMLYMAKINGADSENIKHIEKVYNYVSYYLENIFTNIAQYENFDYNLNTHEEDFVIISSEDY